MIVNVVYVRVIESYLDAFIEASIENHKNTIKEPGNLRFDMLQDAGEPTSFIFYEVFKDEQAVSDHKGTVHYNTWREKVAGWMAQPRKGVKHTVIAPADERQWLTNSI
jgi:autoinducer 2-degrading protein